MELSKELQAELEALARSVAGGAYLHGVNETGFHLCDLVIEAQRLVRKLPDPDLEAARRISSSEYSKIYGRPGSYPDGSIVTQAALAGIRHGRGQ